MKSAETLSIDALEELLEVLNKDSDADAMIDHAVGIINGDLEGDLLLRSSEISNHYSRFRKIEERDDSNNRYKNVRIIEIDGNRYIYEQGSSVYSLII